MIVMLKKIMFVVAVCSDCWRLPSTSHCRWFGPDARGTLFLWHYVDPRGCCLCTADRGAECCGTSDPWSHMSCGAQQQPDSQQNHRGSCHRLHQAPHHHSQPLAQRKLFSCSIFILMINNGTLASVINEILNQNVHLICMWLDEMNMVLFLYRFLLLTSLPAWTVRCLIRTSFARNTAAFQRVWVC